MKVNPNSSVPDVLYLDEYAIQDALSYMEGGVIDEVIERVKSDDEGEGFSKILSERVESRKIDESETDFVRKLDPIGKLAIFRAILIKDSLLIDVEKPLEEEIEFRNMLEIDANIRHTPVDEMKSFFSQAKEFGEAYSDFIDIDEEDMTDVDNAGQIISAVSRGESLFRANSDEIADRDFVLPYDDSKFRKEPLGFPRTNSTYTILIQLAHLFDSDDDSISLINFMNLASRVEENPRKRRRKMSEMKKSFADQATMIAGREVDPSEFEISAPDIEANLYAIYR